MNIGIRSRTTRGVLLVAAAVLLTWGIFRANVLAANVTATWSYDFTPEPACSPTRSTNCIDHFEVQDITDQQRFVLIQKVPTPSAAVGKVDRITTSFKYGPPFGQRTISVVAVGRDPQGNRLSSNPFAARATVSIRLGAKTALIF